MWCSGWPLIKKRSHWPLWEGLLEERRARNGFLRVLVRAGGSSGVGWPSRFLSALSGARGGLLSRNSEIQHLDEAMQRSGQVLLCVFNVPWLPRCSREVSSGAKFPWNDGVGLTA